MSEEVNVNLESFFENSRGLMQFMSMYNSAIKEALLVFLIFSFLALFLAPKKWYKNTIKSYQILALF